MSPLVTGGTAAEEPDEFDVIEIALEDAPDELSEDSALVLGLKGDDRPVSILSTSAVGFSQVGKTIARQFTHLKREEHGYLRLKPNRKHGLSQKRGF